jgi:hypothetical protein
MQGKPQVVCLSNGQELTHGITSDKSKYSARGPFCGSNKKEKNKKKTTAPADDSSEDEAFEGIVRYIARDHLPKRNNNLLPHQKKNTEMQRAVFAALSTILTRKTASLISKFGSINDSLSVSFTLLGSCSIILASFSSGQLIGIWVSLESQHMHPNLLWFPGVEVCSPKKP